MVPHPIDNIYFGPEGLIVSEEMSYVNIYVGRKKNRRLTDGCWTHIK